MIFLKGSLVMYRGPSVSDEAVATRQECADFIRTMAVNWNRLLATGVAPTHATPPGIRPRWCAGGIRAWVKSNNSGEKKRVVR